jgi:hypothetical protein
MSQCVHCAAPLEWRRPYTFKSNEFRAIYRDEGVYTCSSCGLVQADVAKVDGPALDEYYRHIYRRVAGIASVRSSQPSFYYSKRANAICSMIKETHPTGQLNRVFELGPGYGYNLRKVKEEFPNALLFCDELDDDLKNLTGAQSSGLNDGPYDAIILSHVLEHFTDPVGLIKNSVQALASGGVLAIEVPNDFDGTSYITPHDEPHFTFFTARTLQPLLETAGQAKITTMFTIGERPQGPQQTPSIKRRLKRAIGMGAMKIPYIRDVIISRYANENSEKRGSERGVFLRAAMVRS